MSPTSLARKFLHGSVAVTALVSSAVFAQAYPTRPIEVVVHTSAGSGGDIVSRVVTETIRKEKLLSQPLLVQNRVGGAGALAYNYFKTKRGDPYTMLSVTSTLLAMAYRPDVNIGLDNYTPIALMTIDPQSIMVPADSPYKTFKDLVEAARKAPETVVAATTSVTGTGRMVVYLIEKAVPGAKFRFVTFKGGGDAVTATAGGHTHFTTENLGEGVSFVEGKKLRVLAITSDKRLPQAPDTPTLQELGYNITAGTIRGFTFPAGVPKEALVMMEGVLQKVHKSAAWQDVMKRNVYQDIFMGSEQFTKFLAQRAEEYRGFYQAIGATKKKP